MLKNENYKQTHKLYETLTKCTNFDGELCLKRNREIGHDGGHRFPPHTDTLKSTSL